MGPAGLNNPGGLNAASNQLFDSGRSMRVWLDVGRDLPLSLDTQVSSCALAVVDARGHRIAVWLYLVHPPRPPPWLLDRLGTPRRDEPDVMACAAER
jgi:hypothetical protein